MNIKFTWGPETYFHIALVVLGFIAYVVIWRRSYKVAMVILFLAMCWVIYVTADWGYWDHYFKLEWNVSKYAGG